MAACAAATPLLGFKDADSRHSVVKANVSRSTFRRSNTTINAKFERFDGAAQIESRKPNDSVEEVTENRCSALPDTIEAAILESSAATSCFVAAGGKRAIVELFSPELEDFDVGGAQKRIWEYSRLFIESLQRDLNIERIRALFPDAGAAALLNYEWSDATFEFGSLNDRRPVSKEDELVVLVSSDYQMLSDVQRVARFLSEDENIKPLIMWNPRLVNGGIGLGLNARRLRSQFLTTFTTVYSLRPLPTGSVYRRYPGLWEIYLNDEEKGEGYKFVRDQPEMPSADDLDEIVFGEEKKNEENGMGLMSNVIGFLSSLRRFMRSISR